MTKQMMLIKGKTLNLDYNKWYHSAIESRKNYLSSNGMINPHDISAIISMPFNLLPNTVRNQLQTKVIA
jgi:hypothetical protein